LSSRLQHHVASGLAVAAAMAVVVLVAVPLLRQAGSGVGGALDRTSASSAAPSGSAAPQPSASEVSSAGLAADNSNSGDARNARQPRLDPYFQAHRDFTADGVMPAAAIYLRSGNEGER